MSTSADALPRLLLITSRHRSHLPLTEAVASALHALPPNAAMVLLREKDLSGRELADLARALLVITRRHGSRLLVSTRADVAVAVGADGVHLGGDAPPWPTVRTAIPERMLVGISLHADDKDLETAVGLTRPDYALLSPVFPTASKPDAIPLGLPGLASGCLRFDEVPVYALGGIDESNAASCIGAGAHGVAVLGAVLAAPEPGLRALALWGATREHAGQRTSTDSPRQDASLEGKRNRRFPIRTVGPRIP